MYNLENRKYIFIVPIFLIGIVYLFKLFSLQVLNTDYQLSATNNAVRQVIQFPARGLIYDRNGELLVYNKAAYDLLITPREVGVFDTLSLCNLIDISKQQLIERIKSAKEYSSYKSSIIVKQISQEDYAFLQEQLYKFPGFFIQARTLREYPRKIASHFLGYVGEVNQQDIENDNYYSLGDYKGITGIEESYESFLRGEKGVKYFLVDVHNRIKGSYNEGKNDINSQIGNNIITTIDSDLQEYAEMLLQNKKGSIVALEPSTGEILAIASAPGYDPNLLVGRERGANYSTLVLDSLNPLFNRSLMAQYPPGSTFKLAMALIALQEGDITPSTEYMCNYGYHIGSFSLGCHHDQAFDLIGSISQSCNAYYCYVFRGILENPKYTNVREAYDQLNVYLQSFGFGSVLKTDFTNELNGFIPDSDYYEEHTFNGSRWRALPIISMAIGQGEVLVTPLQMANYAAIIANRGFYYIPHAIKEIEGNENIDDRFLEKNYSLINEEYYNEVIKGMFEVMETGTGWRSKIPGIEMCGKTGTAENPHGSDHSVFIAFAPRENPEIAVSVYIENGIEGSMYAAPVASLIIEKYLNDSISLARKPFEARMIEANLLDAFQTDE